MLVLPPDGLAVWHPFIFVRSSIASNTLTEMQVGKAETIELLLSTSSSTEELKQQLTEADAKEAVAGIPTAERMQARLTGDPGFVIQAITPEEQAISSFGTTKWEWDVTPMQAGEEKNLHLTITALIEVAEETIPRTIDTYNRTIMVKEVQKSWGQRVSEFIGNNWQWLWATILAPIALWAYRTYRRRKEAKQKIGCCVTVASKGAKVSRVPPKARPLLSHPVSK